MVRMIGYSKRDERNKLGGCAGSIGELYRFYAIVREWLERKGAVFIEAV